MNHAPYIRISVVLFGLISSSVWSQNKSGLFNYEKVIEILPQYSESMMRLENKRVELENEIRCVTEEFQRIILIPIHRKPMDSIAIAEFNETINAFQIRIEMFREKAIGSYMKLYEKERAFLTNHADQRFAEFCKEMNIDLVAKQKAMLCCGVTEDHTLNFLVYLKEKIDP